MDILSVIEAKKLGRALTREQIDFFVQGAADGTLPDYQLSALLMAIRLNGMDARETADLTDASPWISIPPAAWATPPPSSSLRWWQPAAARC